MVVPPDKSQHNFRISELASAYKKTCMIDGISFLVGFEFLSFEILWPLKLRRKFSIKVSRLQGKICHYECAFSSQLLSTV